jgi:hypothetical protein
LAAALEGVVLVVPHVEHRISSHIGGRMCAGAEVCGSRQRFGLGVAVRVKKAVPALPGAFGRVADIRYDEVRDELTYEIRFTAVELDRFDMAGDPDRFWFSYDELRYVSGFGWFDDYFTRQFVPPQHPVAGWIDADYHADWQLIHDRIRTGYQQNDAPQFDD